MLHIKYASTLVRLLLFFLPHVTQRWPENISPFPLSIFSILEVSGMQYPVFFSFAGGPCGCFRKCLNAEILRKSSIVQKNLFSHGQWKSINSNINTMQTKSQNSV